MGDGDSLSPHVLALLDEAACALLQTDASGLLLRANRQFCVWLGYTREELVGRRKLQDLLTMGGRIFHQTHWLPLMQMQGSVSEVKLEVVHREGHAIPMVMNAVRRHEGVQVVHEIAAFVARDRDKYERELLLSRRKLETAVAEATRLQAEAKGRAQFAEQMMGIVSHDLRNPLSIIQMGAHLLTRGEVSPNQLRVLGRISRAAERSHRLIADLLDFTQARLGSGLHISPATTDLHAFVGETVDELGQAFPGRLLRHVRAGEGGCAIDPDRLSQLLGNLVANAMKYGDPARPVTVTSSLQEEQGEVAVHNWGEPIPDELRPVLFEPMTRGGLTGNDPTRSVGLGLYIVFEIVKAHGGSVDVTSSAATGTSFVARFPKGVASARGG